MPLQNFVTKALPAISAAWLNAIDIIKFTIFADATTKAAARAALTSDAPMSIGQGGTGATSLSGAQTTLGITTPVYQGNIAGAFITYTSNAPLPSLVSGTLLILDPAVSPTPGGWSLNVNGLGGKVVLRHDDYGVVQDGDVVTGTLAMLLYDGELAKFILLNPLTRYNNIVEQITSTTILNATVTAGGVILASLPSAAYLGSSEYLLIEAQALMTKGGTAGLNQLLISQTAGAGTMTFGNARDDRYCVNGIAMYSGLLSIAKQTVVGSITISVTGLSQGSDATCSSVKLTATRIRTKT